MLWHEFEEAAPQLAALGRRRFEATHVALLGTLRRDGTPRISPVEPYLVRGRLLLGVLGASRKAHDLLRDPRCTLLSSVSDVNGSEGEFRLDGRALPVIDPALLGADTEAWWNTVEGSDARVFTIDIAGAAHIAWDTRHGEQRIIRWAPGPGLETQVRRY